MGKSTDLKFNSLRELISSFREDDEFIIIVEMENNDETEESI